MRFLFSLSIFLFFAIPVFSQDTLPRFRVNNLGADAEGNARIVIGWVNPYDSLKQIGIQTSHDSLKNYRTLVSIADPNAKFNGFADNKALNDHMFYRLFIVRQDGSYFFTAPKRPVVDTTKAVNAPSVAVNPNNPTKPPTEIKKPEPPTIIKKPEFVPSFYVYTNKEGYVFVNLPDADKQKYRIKFFEEDESFLFELKTIKHTALTLDKANFMHAGWFLFELYNDEKLVEKHRFYLAKEF